MVWKLLFPRYWRCRFIPVLHRVTILFSHHFTLRLLAETTEKPIELPLFHFLVSCHWLGLFRSFKFVCMTKVIHFVTSWMPLTSSQLFRIQSSLLRASALFSGQGLSAREVAVCGVWLIVTSDRMSGLGSVPDDGVSSVIFSPHTYSIHIPPSCDLMFLRLSWSYLLPRIC